MVETTGTKRSPAKDVEITYGPMSVVGNLNTFRRAVESMTSICPICAADGEAVKVHQCYVCSKEHGRMFEQGQLAKGTMGEDGLVVVGTKEDLDQVRNPKTDEKKRVMLRSYLASEIEENTYPLGPGSYGTAYIFTPTTKSALTGLLMTLCGSDGRIKGEDQDRVLVAEIKLRDNWKVMRIQTWRGHLILQELVRPQDLSVPQAPNVEVDDRYMDLVRTLIETDTQEFKEEDFVDRTRLQMSEFLASKIKNAPIKEHVPDAAVVDLTVALKEAIEGASKAKQVVKAPVVKRQARKSA